MRDTYRQDMVHTSLCPKCGMPVEHLHFNMCEKCYARSIVLMQHPDVVSVQMCPVCGAYRRRGRWVESHADVEDIVLAGAEEKLKLHCEAENPVITLGVEPLGHSTYTVGIHAEASVLGEQVVYEGRLEVRIRFETCDVCSRRAGGYYEAVIQLRGDKRLPDETEFQQYTEIVEQMLNRMQERGERMAFISKTVRLDEGVDIYIGSKKAAKRICQKISSEHAAVFTESASLVGRRDGVDVHRMTYLLRLSRFREGDIIEYEGRCLQVMRVGAHINVLDLSRGVRVGIDKKRIAGARKIAGAGDVRTAIVVSTDESTVQVLDPDTYRTVTLRRPPFLGDAQEVKIIKMDNKILITEGING